MKIQFEFIETAILIYRLEMKLFNNIYYDCKI